MSAPPSSELPPSDPGVALALGSAFLGIYAHGGFLCGLNEAGIFPSHISGASAGALAAGFYAAGLRGDELREQTLSGKLKRSYPDPWIIPRGAPLGFGMLTGLMSGKRVIRHLENQLPIKRIEETPGINLKIAVTNIRKNKASYLSSGPLAKAMMASSAVPILFSEQNIEGGNYFDGGIIHEIPIVPFIDDPAIHTIIVHHITFPHGKIRRMMPIHTVFTQSHRILNHELFTLRKREAERNGKRVIYLETQHQCPGLFQSTAKKAAFFDCGNATGQSISTKISS